MTRYPHQHEIDDPAIDELSTRLFDAVSGPDEDRQHLSDDLRQTLVEAGPRMTDALIGILTDDDLGLTEAPGEGWIPIHAARILSERGDEEAIGPMLEVLSDCHWNEYLYSELIDALGDYGEPVVDPALAALEDAGEGDQQEAYREALLGILAESGVRDDRVFEVLVDALEENPELGASNLSIYGDPRAVEPLSEFLDQMDVDTSDTSLMSNHVIVELSEAIFQLGGTLTSEQQKKVEQVEELRERARSGRHPLFGAPKEQQNESSDNGTYTKSDREEIGRNDPCWCGSGRKYKKCHLPEEKK